MESFGLAGIPAENILNGKGSRDDQLKPKSETEDKSIPCSDAIESLSK